MSDTSVIDQHDSNEASLLDSCAACGPAVLEPGDGASTRTAEWTGPSCEKCEAPLASDVVSICRRCGWYASLGAFLEVDPDWETDEESAPETAKKARPSHLQVWLNMLPRWAWIILASVLIVTIESIAARLMTPAGSALRTAWSLSQLALGLAAVAACHTFNFLAIAADDADVGMLDLLLKPLKLWTRTFQHLPNRLWLVDAAACGLSAAVLSIVVIGGIPYDRLWDWGFKEPPKQNLMGAVMSRIDQMGGEEADGDLEKSINDFAGGKDGNDKKEDKPIVEPPKPKKNADCVILGYQLDADGRVSTLVLGAASGGELVYAGSVKPKLPDDELRDLAASLKAIETPKPFIKLDSGATWVRPKYTCRVSFEKQSKSGRLSGIEWNKMLGSMATR